MTATSHTIDWTATEQSEWDRLLSLPPSDSKLQQQEEFIELLLRKPISEFDKLLENKPAKRTLEIISNINFKNIGVRIRGPLIYYRCSFENCWASEEIDGDLSFISCPMKGGSLATDVAVLFERELRKHADRRLFNSLDPCNFQLVVGAF